MKRGERVQIFNSIEQVKLNGPVAEQEIFIGHIFNTAFYLPRAFAWCMGCDAWRPVPRTEVHAVCKVVRNVARLQLAIYNIFSEGMDQTLLDILKERYPDELLPLLVRSTFDSIQV